MCMLHITMWTSEHHFPIFRWLSAPRQTPTVRNNLPSLHLDIVVQQLRAAFPFCALRAGAQGSRVGRFHRRDALVCAPDDRIGWATEGIKQEHQPGTLWWACFTEYKMHSMAKAHATAAKGSGSDYEYQQVIYMAASFRELHPQAMGQAEAAQNKKKRFTDKGSGAAIRGAKHSSIRRGNNSNNRSAR